MTDRDFGPRPWWEFDPEEVPVPSESLGWEAPDDAELIVNAERQAILREDTEPSVMTLPAVELSQEGHGSRISVGPSSRAAAITAVVLLVVACCAAFVAGWQRGSATVPTSHAAVAAISDRSRLEVARDTSENSSRFPMRGSSAGSKAREVTEGGGR